MICKANIVAMILNIVAYYLSSQDFIRIMIMEQLLFTFQHFLSTKKLNKLVKIYLNFKAK